MANPDSSTGSSPLLRGESKLDDFARTAVTADANVSAARVALILVGMTIALPAFVLGGQLGIGLGLRGVLEASFGGGALLAFVAAATAAVGAKSRLSSYVLITRAFGETGGKIVNAALAFSLVGWFGVVAMMFGDSVAQCLGSKSTLLVQIAAIVGSVLMTISALVGFKALDRLSIVLTPLKALLLIGCAVISMRKLGWDLAALSSYSPSGSISGGVGIVVGGLIAAVTIQPDICRFVGSPVRAALASALVFGLIFPIVLLLSAVPVITFLNSDYVHILVMLGLGIPALLIVMLAAWTANTYNVYASSLAMSTMSARVSRARWAVLVGIIGTLLGLFGISSQLATYLGLLSTIIPPISGIYILAFYFDRRPLDGGFIIRQWRPTAFLAWGAGAAIGSIEIGLGKALLFTPALDSLAASALLFAMAYVAVRRPLGGSSFGL
jgi:cytosine permease